MIVCHSGLPDFRCVYCRCYPQGGILFGYYFWLVVVLWVSCRDGKSGRRNFWAAGVIQKKQSKSGELIIFHAWSQGLEVARHLRRGNYRCRLGDPEGAMSLFCTQYPTLVHPPIGLMDDVIPADGTAGKDGINAQYSVNSRCDVQVRRWFNLMALCTLQIRIA